MNAVLPLYPFLPLPTPPRVSQTLNFLGVAAVRHSPLIWIG